MSSAPAKVILFGEHAVVYHQPAIAIPVSDLRAYAEIEMADYDGFRIVARDLDDEIIEFDGDNPLSKVVRLTLDVLEQMRPDLSIAVRSDIPIASGLGSGAAISTAIVRLLADHFGQSLTEAAINEIVYDVEKIHHGTPSGIDNTVIVYERPVWFVRDEALEMMTVGAPMQIIIADTGQRALTKHAVGDVRKLYDADTEAIQPVLDEIGAIATDARTALAAGDDNMLGGLMLRNHHLLQRLTVSSDQLDHLVEVAINAGALGAKLSGGGRGGNMIALVTDDTANAVKAALLAGGAARIFMTTLEKTS